MRQTVSSMLSPMDKTEHSIITAGDFSQFSQFIRFDIRFLRARRTPPPLRDPIRFRIHFH